MSDIDNLAYLAGQLHQGATKFSDAAATLRRQAQQLDWSAEDLASGVDAWAGKASKSFQGAWERYHTNTTRSADALDATSQALTKLAKKIDDSVDQMRAAQAAQTATGWLTVGLVVLDVVQLGLDPVTDAATVGMAGADVAATEGADAAATAILEADTEIGAELESIVGDIENADGLGDIPEEPLDEPGAIDFSEDDPEAGGDSGGGDDGGGDDGNGGDGNGNGDFGNGDFENDPEVQSQGRSQVQQIREDNNLTSNRQMSRNVATSDYDIDGDVGNMKAISGPEKDGFVEGPPEGGNYFDPPGTGNNPRTADTEYKILEKIADNHWSDDPAARSQVTGVIRLYSERIPCDSCADVIRQFQEAFPNIRIIVGWG